MYLRKKFKSKFLKVFNLLKAGVGSLVDLEGGVNRAVKTNTQTFIKFTQRQCRSGGRQCQTAALTGQNSGTAAPADNFESQFKIRERKLRSEKLPSLLQV